MVLGGTDAGRGGVPMPGVDPEEWAELTERGAGHGSVHAEEVALVLRNVELTGDVLEATR